VGIASLGHRVVIGQPLEHAKVGACSATLSALQTDETQTAGNLANLVAKSLEAFAGHFNLVTRIGAAVEYDSVALVCSLQDASEGFAFYHWVGFARSHEVLSKVD